MATAHVGEFKTLGDVARAAGAHPNSVRKIVGRMGIVVGRIAHCNLIRVEDFPAAVAEVKSRMRPPRSAA